MRKSPYRSRFSGLLTAALLGAALLASLPAGAADKTLKNLMKQMGASVTSGDVQALGPIFEKTKALAKPEYANWGSIADKGKAAAAKGDLAAAKATCKECHDSYRGDYKKKYGSKAP